MATNYLEETNKVLTDVANQIEKECGLTNGAWLTTFILLFMDKNWQFDRSYLAKIYQAIEIIEKNEALKNLFATGEANNE